MEHKKTLTIYLMNYIIDGNLPDSLLTTLNQATKQLQKAEEREKQLRIEADRESC